jgi:hypothetical protein
MSSNNSRRSFINKQGTFEEIHREFRVGYRTLYNSEAEEEMLKSIDKSEAFCRLIKYALTSRYLISIRDQDSLTIEKNKTICEDFYIHLGKITTIVNSFEFQYVIKTSISSTELLDSMLDTYFEYVSQLRKTVYGKTQDLFGDSRATPFLVKEEFERMVNPVFEIDEVNGEIKTYEKKCKFINKDKEAAFTLKFDKKKNEFFIDSIGALVSRDKDSREVLYRF